MRPHLPHVHDLLFSCRCWFEWQVCIAEDWGKTVCFLPDYSVERWVQNKRFMMRWLGNNGFPWRPTFLINPAQDIYDTWSKKETIWNGYSKLFFLKTWVFTVFDLTYKRNCVKLVSQYSVWDRHWWCYWQEVTFTTLLPLLINWLCFPTGC